MLHFPDSGAKFNPYGLRMRRECSVVPSDLIAGSYHWQLHPIQQ